MLTRENIALTLRLEDGALIAEMRGEIDHHTARLLREEIDRRIYLEMPRLLTLEMSGISFMDSSGIGLIVGRLERMRSLGGALEIRGLSPRLKALLDLSGVERLPSLTVNRSIAEDSAT